MSLSGAHDCNWREPADPFEHDLGMYPSDCGYEFCFEEGGPVENGFKWCPKCGGHITYIPLPKEVDDE